MGVGPPKSGGKLKLSDFDENRYPGVFDVADFKNRTHFIVESFSGFIVGFWGPLSFSLKVFEIQNMSDFCKNLANALPMGLCKKCLWAMYYVYEWKCVIFAYVYQITYAPKIPVISNICARVSIFVVNVYFLANV